MADEIIGLKVELDTSGASAPMASLKSQIKEATNELVNFTGKFGATSKEAINAAKRVAELKDRLGDARQMVDAFNPDAKFNSLTQAIQGAAGAFQAVQGAMGLFGAESENTQKALLKVQSAMAFSQGLSSFLDGGIEGFRNLYRVISTNVVAAFTALKAAIGSTGIGLLVIAIGAIAANWSKITTAISGVSDEQRKLNDLGRENLKKEEDKLKHINSQDNVLKLQGKSERQILEYKIQQIAAVIKATEQQIKSEIALNKAAVDAAVRNKAILISILDIVQYPIIKLLEGIDSIGSAFGKQFGLASGFKNLEANFLFDPEQIKKDGKATVDELNKTLDQLKNDQAGLKLSVIGIDDKAAEDAKKKEKERQDERKRLAKEGYNKDLELLKESLENEKLTFAERRKLVLANTKLTAEDRKKLNKEIDEDERKAIEEHNKKIDELNKKYEDERLDRLADTNVKKEELDYQRRLAEINSLAQTETEKFSLIEKLNAEHEARMIAAKQADADKAAADQKKIDDDILKKDKETKQKLKEEEELLAEAKKEIQDSTFMALEGGIKLVSDLFGKSKAVQAAALIADSAVGIAKIIVNTQTANAAVTAKYALLPGGPALAATEITLNKINAGIGIAANVAATAKALSALNSGGTASGSSAGGAAPNAPGATVFNTTTKLNKDSIDKINDKAVKAYVVETDINNGQKRIERILINTKFK
jgi:hypothetical protein